MKLIRAVFLLVHLVVASLLLAMLLNAYVPPTVFLYLNLLSLAFPFLMGFHLLLTFFWILSQKKRSFFFLLISVLFFNPTIRWVNYHPNQKEGEIKVLTMNTRSGKLGQTALDAYLKQYQNYDIIFLQEDRTEPFHNSASYDISKLITPHKILKQGKILPDTVIGESFYADIEINGKTVRAINVYLEPFQLNKEMVRPTGSSQVNEEKAKTLVKTFLPIFKIHQYEIREIRKFIEASPYPVILAGDFNSVPNSYEYFQISKVLSDAFVVAGHGSGTSFHDYKIPIRIDYIFTSPALKAVSYKVDRSVRRSDHFAVTASFNFK